MGWEKEQEMLPLKNLLWRQHDFTISRLGSTRNCSTKHPGSSQRLPESWSSQTRQSSEKTRSDTNQGSTLMAFLTCLRRTNRWSQSSSVKGGESKLENPREVTGSQRSSKHSE